MSLLEPEEIRYTIISMISLSIMTSMMVFMGYNANRYEASEANEPSSGGYGISDRQYWEELQNTDLFGGGVFDAIIDVLFGGIVRVVDVMTAWSTVVTEAGWAAPFIVIPSVVLLFIVIGAVIKVIGALPYT